MNLFGIFAFSKAFFSPKSEIYTPKRDDEHPCPSHMGILFLDPFHIQGFTLTKVIKQTPEQLEIGQWLSLDVADRGALACTPLGETFQHKQG